MPLSEHVYCVAVSFKLTDWVVQWICIKFCISLNIALWELFRWFRRPQPWATGDWQLHHDNTPPHASHLVQSFLAKSQITQVTQHSLQPRPGTLQLLPFPKTFGKSPLKGKRFQTINGIQESSRGQLMVIAELCEVSRYLLWRGLRCHCPVYNVSCILYFL